MKRLTSQESRLIDRLRQQPELMERFESIIDLAQTREGEVRRADEVEEDLVKAVRQLGREVMESWAEGAEQEVSRQLKEQKKSVRKKKR
jgi:vacuolar-type H+-ATPase subunit H